MYRVVVERSAEKDLRKLPLDVRLRVADALRSPAKNPRPVGSRKLVRNEARLADSRGHLSCDLRDRRFD
jgi:mRNA interferase RelE/StbE